VINPQLVDEKNSAGEWCRGSRGSLFEHASTKARGTACQGKTIGGLSRARACRKPDIEWDVVTTDWRFRAGRKGRRVEAGTAGAPGAVMNAIKRPRCGRSEQAAHPRPFTPDKIWHALGKV